MEQINMLDKLRDQIDKTDEELLILFKRRFQTAKKIAKYKKENNLNITDSNRENILIMKNIAKSRTMDLDETFIREFFEILIDESKKIQEKELNK